MKDLYEKGTKLGKEHEMETPRLPASFLSKSRHMHMHMKILRCTVMEEPKKGLSFISLSSNGKKMILWFSSF